MYYAIYVEVNVLNLILLTVILLKTTSSTGLANEVSAFRNIVIASFVPPITDILWVLGENSIITISPVVNAVMNSIYMVFTVVIAFLWLIFCEEKLKIRPPKKSLRRFISSFPLIIVFLLIISSIWTGWIFYIDSSNHYQRGSLYLIQIVACYFYMIIAFFRSVFKGYKQESFSKRREAFILASFVLTPALGALIQAFVYGLPTAQISITISLLFIFISFQETNISSDSLTGLNNRRSADEYLQNTLSNIQKNHRMLYFIMDIDYFKNINDTYGHVEGDRALVTVAEALRMAAGNHDLFVARLGGDEFCAIAEFNEIERPDTFSSAIQKILNQHVTDKKLPYHLELSIGYAEYNEATLSTKSIIDNADKMLYRHKKLHHSQNRNKR